MALDCRSRCGASEYVEDVANPNWCQVEARLQVLESAAGVPLVFTYATRPAANSVPVGRMIFNTDEPEGGAPQWSNGVNWVDASGNIT